MMARERAYRDARDAERMDRYDCFCGEGFRDRNELIRHNVDAHHWKEDESRQAVMRKYPM